MSPRCLVLIAAPDLMPKLKERAAEPAGELLTFSDTDALRALEAILKRRPDVVALEQRFSTTPRGTALINRIKADPTLTQAEIRLVAQDGTHTVLSGPQTAAAPAQPGKPAPAKPAGAPAGDVWSKTQPRRVDAAPAAVAPPAPPKPVAPPAPAKLVSTPAPTVKPIETRPPVPAAPPAAKPVVAAPAAQTPAAPAPVAPVVPVIDDRRLEAEAPVELIELAVETESAGIELPADWIEPTTEAAAVVEAAPVVVQLADEYEIVTNAGDIVTNAGDVVTSAGQVVETVDDVVSLDLPTDEPAPVEPPPTVVQAMPAGAPSNEAIAIAEVDSAPADAPPAAAAGPAVAPLLDKTGTRRAPRFKTADTAGLLLDGNNAKLVDLSIVGAQVLSSGVLKPNQRVRLALTDKQGSIKISGSVAWALFEIPPRYRAGIAFLDADPKAVEAFCDRHKKS